MNNFIEIEYRYQRDILPDKFKNKEHSNEDWRVKTVHNAIINLNLIQGIEPYSFNCKNEHDEIKIIRYKIIYSNTEYIITEEEFKRIKEILLSKEDIKIS